MLKAPNAALHFTPPGSSDSALLGLWTLDRGALRKVPVKVGISDGEWTEITADAPAAGVPVIVELTTGGRAAYGIHH